jgi:hypothetical protein
MDMDGDGSVSAEELRASAAYRQLAQASAPPDALLRALDADGSGALSFEECITLFYLLAVRGGRACRSCGACILRVGFTCTVCWQRYVRTRSASRRADAILRMYVRMHRSDRF